jgi:hypothetical protein
MHEREAKHKPTLFETLTAWFTIVICIVSMGLAINTYMLMLTAAAEVGDIVTNWETVPVTDMTIPAAGTSCPSGYDDNSNFFNLPSNGDRCVISWLSLYPSISLSLYLSMRVIFIIFTIEWCIRKPWSSSFTEYNMQHH